MMETRYLVAYRDSYSGFWHSTCGCDREDVCLELIESASRTHPDRQYGVFWNAPSWWLGLPRYVTGLTDGELYRKTFGCDMPIEAASS